MRIEPFYELVMELFLSLHKIRDASLVRFALGALTWHCTLVCCKSSVFINYLINCIVGESVFMEVLTELNQICSEKSVILTNGESVQE